MWLDADTSVVGHHRQICADKRAGYMRLQLDGSIKIISAGNWQVGGRIRSLSLLLRGSVHIITRSSVSPATQASDVRFVLLSDHT